MIRAVAAAALSVLSAAPAVAAMSPAAPDEATLALTQASRDYPLYWLGRHFDGLPLTGVVQVDGPSQRVSGLGVVPGDRHTSFIYGTCEIPPGRSEGGCAPPLQIQIRPVCSVPPMFSPQSPRPVRRIGLRGARAFLFPGARWELHTRHVVVTAFSGLRGRRALHALTGLNPLTAGVTAGEDLPAPDPRTLAGRLACQRAFDVLGRRAAPAGP